MTVTLVTFADPGSVNKALTALRMAAKLDLYRPTARMALAPWLVEQALERLGDRRLSRKQQMKVMKAIRTPKKSPLAGVVGGARVMGRARLHNLKVVGSNPTPATK